LNHAYFLLFFCRRTKKMKFDIIKVRRQLHGMPELGFEEHQTSRLIAQILRSFGLEVHENIARTGVVGVLRGQDETLPVLGYRADMDALPVCEMLDVPWRSTNGCMHACGHDAHMAIALGAAHVLASERPKRGIVFIFQPNEEGAPGELPSGAELMCQEGILERFHISQMLALHCDPTLSSGKMGVCHGALWAASGRFKCKVLGKPSHAAYPHKGCDALRAAAEMCAICHPMYQVGQLPDEVHGREVFSICKLQAGTAFNVIAGEAEFEGIIRACSHQRILEMAQKFEKDIQKVASIYGVSLQLECFLGAESVVNDEALKNRAWDVWDDMGMAQNISMTMAAEDFSHFSTKIPSFYAMLGVRPKEMQEIPPLHSDYFTIDEQALEVGVQAMTALIRTLCV
jgi:amidohydrolase